MEEGAYDDVIIMDVSTITTILVHPIQNQNARARVFTCFCFVLIDLHH